MTRTLSASDTTARGPHSALPQALTDPHNAYGVKMKRKICFCFYAETTCLKRGSELRLVCTIATLATVLLHYFATFPNPLNKLFQKAKG